MERTINGKPLNQVEKELRAPFKPDDFKINLYGYSYLPVEKYMERLDEVIGVLNYDFVPSNPVITVIGTRPQISLFGSITIRDDEGKPVAVKGAPGGCQVIMSNKENEPVLLKNDLESAAADAFKRCCKELGIAKAQLKQLRESGDNKQDKRGIVDTQEVMLYRVTLKEAFSSVGRDGFGANVDIEGEDEPRKLMIWKSAQQEIEKHMPMSKFIQNYRAGTSFRIYGCKTVFPKKNNTTQLQLTMERPFTGDEEGG